MSRKKRVKPIGAKEEEVVVLPTVRQKKIGIVGMSDL